MNVMLCPEEIDYPKPFKLTCSCDVSVAENVWCEITFVAIIDTGNQISLLKRESIPNNFDAIKLISKNCYFLVLMVLSSN